MSLDILKRDAELLVKITQKYLDLLEINIPSKQKKRIEDYINSVLVNIEKHIEENVEEPNKVSSKAG